MTLQSSSGFSSYENGRSGNVDTLYESHDAMWWGGGGGMKKNTPMSSIIELSEMDRRELAVDRRVTDSSQPVVPCGTPMARRLDRSQNKGNSNCAATQSCDRAYILYLPTAACPSPPLTIMDREETTTTTTTSSSLRLPLVFAVHCLGCSASTMIDWKELAEQYSFVLAIPEGIQNSFNAGHACCGYAHEKGLDDRGFFQDIISELELEFPFVSSNLVYAFGWSNGGYMVSYAASLFRAVVPIAGYQVDLEDAISKPTAVFLHHSQDDPTVQMTGCCTDPTMPLCCCSLSNFDDTCTTMPQKAYEWSTRVNGCSQNHTPLITYSTHDVTCYSFEQCLANTTYCIHQHKGHFIRPSFSSAFPMFHEIAEFFARDACSSVHPPHPPHGGQWIVDDSTAQSQQQQQQQQQRRGSCHCTKDWQGVYCLEEKVAMDATDATDAAAAAATDQPSETRGSSSSAAVQLKSTNAMIVMVVLATVVISLYYFYHRAYRQKKRYAGFSKVSTIEMRSR